MQSRQLSTSVAPVVLLAALLNLTLADEQPSAEPDQQTGGSRLEISNETTHIVEPLDESGNADYLEAVNQQLRKGVTAQNNAAVAVCRAIGPKSDVYSVASIRAEFFRRLGIDVVPEEGDYLVSIDELVRRENENRDPPIDLNDVWDDYYNQQEKSMEAPWSRQDLPIAAKWLDVNEKPLKLVTEGVKRERWYVPLVTDGEPLIAVILPMIQECRNIARVYKARAMLRLANGDTDGAWDDLMTIHRLARHVGQGLTLVDRLVGIAIDSLACEGDRVLAHSGQLMSGQLLRYRRELETLPALPGMADAMDTGERYMFLDAVSHLAKGTPGAAALLDLAGEVPDGPVSRFLSRTMIDWNEPLRMGNPWYDDLAEAGRKPTYRQRVAAMSELEERLEDLAKSANFTSFALKFVLGGSPRKTVGRGIGSILIASLVPAIRATIDAEARAEMNLDLTRLTFALAAYKTARGEYPDTLQQLVPTYIPTLPTDFYVEQPLVYSRDADGYLVYSLGPNGKDDGGSGPWSGRKLEDDLAVRFPRPPQ